MQIEHVVRGQGTYVGGVMGSGKSLFVLGWANRDKAEGYPHEVIQHVAAPRTKRPDEVISRSGLIYTGAFVYRRVDQIAKRVSVRQPRRIYLTDLHFVDKDPGQGNELYELVIKWLDEGRQVVIDSLERDFRGRTFETPLLICGLCEVKHYFTTTCAFPGCESQAHYNQRLHHGQPVPYNSPRFEPDTEKFRAFKSYEARCREHFSCPKEMGATLKGILDAIQAARETGRRNVAR